MIFQGSNGRTWGVLSSLVILRVDLGVSMLVLVMERFFGMEYILVLRRWSGLVMGI